MQAFIEIKDFSYFPASGVEAAVLAWTTPIDSVLHDVAVIADAWWEV